MSLTNILKTWKSYPSIILEKYPYSPDFYTRYGPIHLAEGFIASGLVYSITEMPESVVIAPLMMIARNIQLVINYGKK